MRIVINGILKEFPQIKDEKPKVKVEKLNLSKLNKSSYVNKVALIRHINYPWYV